MAETPVAETPVAETPVAETPVAETPVAETPVAETMMAETTMEKVKPAAVAIKGRTGLSLGQLSSLMWIYWAYVLCYLLRKNYPLLLPNLAAAELLTTSQAGIVASVFEAVVGVVKLVCGVWVDRAASPAKLLSGCLAVAAAPAWRCRPRSGCWRASRWARRV